MGSGSQASEEDIDAVLIGRDDVSDYNPGQLLPELPEVIAKIRAWLQPTAYDIAGGEYRRHLSSHVAGTGHWLTSSKQYQEWMTNEEHGMLWIKGIPGSGKSKQLKKYVEENRSLDSISPETMWNHLRLAFVGLPGKVFCVADALDEMDRGNEGFLKTLGDISQWRPKTVKFLITSRPVSSVEEALVDVDISTYVHFALSRSNIPESDWKTIADAVPGRANGLFLYAKLAMDAFLEPNVDINTVLLKLPTDLNALYTDLLSEHAKRSGVPGNIQHLILQSVTHATRPLRLLELAEMIRISMFNDSKWDIKATKGLIRAACGPLLEILPDETVSVIHHSFTEYLKGTTRPGEGQHIGYPCILYLKSGCLNSITLKTDEEIADMPRTQLQYPFFEYAASNWYQHIAKSEAAGQDQKEINAKLDELFGLDNNMRAWLQMRWPEYSLGARSVTQLHIAAKKGLVSYVKELLGSFDINVPDFYDRTPLWWAASEGHAEIVSILIEGGADPDRPDSYSGRRPLHVAASHDHPEAVTTLLKAGVSPSTKKTLENPWFRSRRSPSSIGDTPVQYACNGHFKALEAFLPFIRDDLDLMHRALAWAAGLRSSKCVDLLLQQQGVDINKTIDGQTLLYRACEAVDEGMVAMLLKAGADVSIICDAGDDATWRWKYSQDEPAKLTCLFALCNRHGSEYYNDKLQVIFRLLVEAGVDIHYRTPLGETALHNAAHCPVLIKLLLEAGLDANATDIDGATPLHFMRSGMVPLIPSIELFVEQGHVDINAAKECGRTILHDLILNGDEPSTMRFLEYGPNCNAVDNMGNTPLHTLMQVPKPTPEMVKALLAGGVDPNARNHDGMTALLLWNRSSDSRTDILDMLLEAGADINTVDKDGNNLIFRSLSVFLFMNAEDPHKDIKYLIDRGVSPFQRNFRGETALHYAMRCPHAYESRLMASNPVTRVDFLISLGLDVKAVDYNGNNLLHTVAVLDVNHSSYEGPRLLDLWEKLLALGLDLEQKNHAGRTPLHFLCAYSNRWLRMPSGETMPIDLVISRTKNVNVPDDDGIAPLHLAVSTCGEVYAKKLIEAGANPLVSTHEGLTPLHLAARGRDSNNVGLLLDALRKRQQGLPDIDITQSGQANSSTLSKMNDRRAVMGVNAKVTTDSDAYTPLYYACRSGRPETVSLLLEAGADAKLKGIFEGCLEFEEECERWKHPRPQQDGGEYQYKAALKLRDPYRHIARLEEIVDMLVEHGADISLLVNRPGRHKEGIINTAVEKQRNYTAACLMHALDTSTTEGLDELTKFAQVARRHEQEAAFKALTSSALIRPGDKDQSVPLNFVTRFLIRREYHLLEELSRLGATFLPKFTPGVDYVPNENATLEHLIKLGFTSLVDKIATIETEAQLEKGEWHAFGDKTRPGLFFSKRDGTSASFSPFLLTAVQRELPNMDMVRLLVEKFAVNINETDTDMESALFWVARGNCWWQVHQALPYLLDAGADIHMRNAKGKTPLHMALQGDGEYLGPFNWDAAKILIERGADVNAVDSQGQSCLACAQHNVDMVNLLVKHGAIVTLDSIFGAIESGNAEVLQALLSSGISLNALGDAPPREEDERRRRKGLKVPETHKEFPLHYAARYLSLSWTNSNSFCRELPARMKIIEILIQHGADPFAKFLKKDKRPEDKSSLSETQIATIDVPKGWSECTLLHEVLTSDIIADPFLQIPNLDVNYRDAKGRTLLHAICHNKGGYHDGGGPDHIIGSDTNKDVITPEERVSSFERLLSLGAELEATDNFGRNVIHYMFAGGEEHTYYFGLFRKSLAYILEEAPNLMNQADGNGDTPFHYAVRRDTADELDMLLAAGADHTVVNNKGETLLHILIKSISHLALRNFFHTLVDRGIDINARNNRGETALFSFYSLPKTERWLGLDDSDKPRPELVKPMLENLGGDFFARDNRGRGLLHAAAAGDVERFQELMDIGLDPMMEDSAQQTAIDAAAACGNRDVLELFEKKE
ncbi:ankyrin repeats (many copies) domain-containing protein [Trichoderma breve]|uniref:Ankyrin repeats (Many copies) domain-containing protein n=1 Tax=Trichoderma breve TaxID=2034170 RepID=A0A9W9B2Z3_9HYPO|nr:ankyrin repeats (many copies) domain-containing protein [Trichoderma breve]KAJ4854858.1 ankyrin repeats (many copies) domain-containing protein [Trichoderma breve]